MWLLYCLQHLLQGHRWQWPSSPPLCLMGDVVCDDVLLTVWAICQHMTACFQPPFLSHKCGSRHTGVGRGKVVAMWRMDICTVCMKRSGLGAYCCSNISETLERQQRWNPGSSTKLCQSAGESCRCRRLNLYCPFLSVTLASLGLIVSALQTLSILSCLKLDAASKRKNESIAAVNRSEHSLWYVNFLSPVCVPHQTSLCSMYARGNSFPPFPH